MGWYPSFWGPPTAKQNVGTMVWHNGWDTMKQFDKIGKVEIGKQIKDGGLWLLSLFGSYTAGLWHNLLIYSQLIYRCYLNLIILLSQRMFLHHKKRKWAFIFLSVDLKTTANYSVLKIYTFSVIKSSCCSIILLLLQNWSN